MIQPRSGSGLRPRHGAAVVVGAVLAAIVAFWAFSFVVGAIAFIVKLVLVLAVLYGITRFVLRHARS